MRKDIVEASLKLNNHGVVAFPTETVMGLGVVYDDFEAYKRLNFIKQRPEDKPYTMMLFDTKDIEKYAVLNEKMKKIINAFCPGPLTLLLPLKEGSVPSWVTHGGNVIGIRIPNHKLCLELLKQVDKPLLVPSANKSGYKPAMTAKEVKSIFNNELDFIIEEDANNDSPSTIIDLTNDNIKLIRQGSISLEEISNVLKEN